MKRFITTLQVYCFVLLVSCSALADELIPGIPGIGGVDPISNLARNIGSFMQSLCPPVTIIGGVGAIISRLLGNKDGLAWSIGAIVMGVLGMSLPAIINLVRSWTMS